MFFMTFDVDLHLFVPVLKVEGKAFRCFLCRIPSSARGICGHEDGSKRACEQLRGQEADVAVDDLDFGFLNEYDNSDNIISGDPDPISGPNFENDDRRTTTRPNRSITVPEVYTPINVRRPILPCRGEWSDMETISKALDAVKENEILVIEERNKATCHKCGLLNKKQCYEGYARDVFLFTLNQGTHKIKVYDWWCDTCQEKRKFSGRGTGVFPAQKNSAFTTELMYQWLQMTCFQGYPFRSAYQTTRGIQRSPSTVMRNKKIRSNALPMPEEDAMSRRRANDALRAFIALLDTNSPMMTSTYFSCEKCEVPLSAADCAELGISQEQGKRFKRFKAVVIDGTAAGILTELPPLKRNHETVPAPKSRLSSLQKLVKSNPHRKVLKKLMQMTRQCLRERKKMSKRLSSSQTDDLKFWISKSGDVCIKEISDPKELMTETECKIVQLFLHDCACFCPKDMQGRPIVQNTEHTTECINVRKAFSKAKEHPSISSLLRSVFSITHGNLEQAQREEMLESSQMIAEDHSQENDTETTEGENARNEEEDCEDTQDDEGDYEVDDEGDRIYENVTRSRRISGVWASLIPPNAEKNSQLIESTLLLLDFLLLQNVAMPYMGRLPVEQTTTGDSERETTMLSFTEKAMKVHSDLICAMDIYSNPCTHTREGRSFQAKRKECMCVSRMKQATLMVTRANPNLGAFCQEILKLKRPMQIAYRNLVKSVIAVLQLHIEAAKKYFIKFERKSSEQCWRYWNLWGRLEGDVEDQSGVQTSPVSSRMRHNRNESESGDEDTKDVIPEKMIGAVRPVAWPRKSYKKHRTLGSAFLAGSAVDLALYSSVTKERDARSITRNLRATALDY